MAIDLAEKSSGPTPEFLASSPPDHSECGGRGFPGAPPGASPPGTSLGGVRGTALADGGRVSRCT